MTLSWLPPSTEWRPQLRAIIDAPITAWPNAVALANTHLDFIRTNALDQAVLKALDGALPDNLATKPVLCSYRVKTLQMCRLKIPQFA